MINDRQLKTMIHLDVLNWLKNRAARRRETVGRTIEDLKRRYLKLRREAK